MKFNFVAVWVDSDGNSNQKGYPNQDSTQVEKLVAFYTSDASIKTLRSIQITPAPAAPAK